MAIDAPIQSHVAVGGRQQGERQDGEHERRRVVEEAEATGLLDGRVVEALAGEDAARRLVVGEEVEAERPGGLGREDHEPGDDEERGDRRDGQRRPRERAGIEGRHASGRSLDAAVRRSAPTGWSCPGPWGGGRSPDPASATVSACSAPRAGSASSRSSILVWVAVSARSASIRRRPGSDAWNYLAAGERLNAGHPLYALVAGRPPGAAGAAVLVRAAPRAAADRGRCGARWPSSASRRWSSGRRAGLVVTLADGRRRSSAGGGLVVAAIDRPDERAPLALQSLSGNVNGAPVRWPSSSPGSGGTGAPLVGDAASRIAIAVKLTPRPAVVWLVTARTVAGRRGDVVALAAIGVVSLLGAGLQNHLDWLAVAARQSAPAPTSLAALTGLPSWRSSLPAGRGRRRPRRPAAATNG